MEKNTEPGIAEIINQGYLEDFILGKGEFLTYRPENDYTRWRYLEKYFNNLHPQDEHKTFIINTILSLYERDKGVKPLSKVQKFLYSLSWNYRLRILNEREYEKRCALMLSWALNVKEIIPKITSTVESDDYFQLLEGTQKIILIAATKLEIDDIREFIVQEEMRKDELFSFLLWTDPLNKEIITDHDLWRMESVEAYYKESSPQEREFIAAQVEQLAQNKNIKIADQFFINLFRSYLKRDGIRKDFATVLENYINKNSIPTESTSL
jgi:hypothetical protein